MDRKIEFYTQLDTFHKNYVTEIVNNEKRKNKKEMSEVHKDGLFVLGEHVCSKSIKSSQPCVVVVNKAQL